MELRDYQPFQMPESLIQVPAFVWRFGKDFSQIYEKARKENNNFEFHDGLRGANSFMTGLVNKVFADNGAKFRTVTPSDNIYETIYPILMGKFSVQLNAFDVWQKAPKGKESKKIWREIHELTEEHLGRKPQGTFRVQGFYAVPCKKWGGTYQTRILPAPNFEVIEDDKLDLPSGTRFNSTNKKGLIIPNNKGRFAKYTLLNGVSDVSVSRKGDFYSNNDGDFSYRGNYDTRVAVVASEELKT